MIADPKVDQLVDDHLGPTLGSLREQGAIKGNATL